jgi:hypothetical protein
MAIGLPIALRANHLLSHDGESFFGMQRDPGASRRTALRSDYSRAKNIFCWLRLHDD